MFKLKLSALRHPNPTKIRSPDPNAYNSEDEKEYRSVVLWLEDQKIRHYKIEEREGLRNIEDDNWVAAYKQYQKDLASPVINGDLDEQLNWLLSYAVRLEYADNAAKYNKGKKKQPKKAPPKVVSSNPLDKLDFDSPSFKTGVDNICKVVGVAPHPDHKQRLAAVAKVLKTAPHPDCPQSDINIVKEPTDVLNLLFVQDLRDLQTKINETLVSVQKVTADPKTDTKLGKVGK